MELKIKIKNRSNDVSPEIDLSVKSGDKYTSLGNIQTYRLVKSYDLRLYDIRTYCNNFC